MLRLHLSPEPRHLALHQRGRRAGQRAPGRAVARQQWRGAATLGPRRPRHCRSARLHRRRRDRIRRGRSDPEGLEAARRRAASGDAARRPAPRPRRGARGFFDEAFHQGEEEQSEACPPEDDNFYADSRALPSPLLRHSGLGRDRSRARSARVVGTLRFAPRFQARLLQQPKQNPRGKYQ